MKERAPITLLAVLLSLVMLLPAAANADKRCPGGCAATVSINNGPALQTTFNVDLQIGDFEPISPTVRRAPVRFNNLDNPTLGIHLRIAEDRPSYFYLESQSPTGSPFFPADSHGDYFFVMHADSLGFTVRNEQPMIVQAEGLMTFPPPAPFQYTLQQPVEFTDSQGNIVVVHAGTVTIVSDLPTAPPAP